MAMVSAELHCAQKPVDMPKSWIDMDGACVKQMKDQIQEELKASMQYLAMGAHFSRDAVNRPGFAELFFKSASEEREHAIKLITYLLMRGDLTKDVSSLLKTYYPPATTTWENGVAALSDALKLEALVTKSIRNVIQVCEGSTPATSHNDYHLADYLTGDFLEEQYHGQRDLAGKISTLGKMMERHGALGEFMFDKKLLE